MHSNRLKLWIGLETSKSAGLPDFYRAVDPRSVKRVALLFEKYLKSCCVLRYEQIFDARIRLSFGLSHHCGRCRNVLLSLAFLPAQNNGIYTVKGILQDLRIMPPSAEVQYSTTGPPAFTDHFEELIDHPAKQLYTKTERKVISLLLKGSSNKEISARLHVCIATVKTHLSNIYRKSGCASRAEYIALHAGGERNKESLFI